MHQPLDADAPVLDPTTPAPTARRTPVTRRTRLAAAVLAIVALATVAAPAAFAAKPAPPPPMTVSCSIVGPITTGWAYDPPRGTKSVYFLFYRDEAAASDPYFYGANGGTDFDGRDGWTSYGEANAPAGWNTAPTWMVVTAYDRKGNTLAQTATSCPTP